MLFLHPFCFPVCFRKDAAAIEIPAPYLSTIGRDLRIGAENSQHDVFCNLYLDPLTPCLGEFPCAAQRTSDVNQMLDTVSVAAVSAVVLPYFLHFTVKGIGIAQGFTADHGSCRCRVVFVCRYLEKKYLYRTEPSCIMSSQSSIDCSFARLVASFADISFLCSNFSVRYRRLDCTSLSAERVTGDRKVVVLYNSLRKQTAEKGYKQCG